MGKNTKRNAVKKRALRKAAIIQDGADDLALIASPDLMEQTEIFESTTSDIGDQTTKKGPLASTKQAMRSKSAPVNKETDNVGRDVWSKHVVPPQSSTPSSVWEGKQREVFYNAKISARHTRSYTDGGQAKVSKIGLSDDDANHGLGVPGAPAANDWTKRNDFYHAPLIKYPKAASGRSEPHDDRETAYRRASESPPNWTTHSPSVGQSNSENSWGEDRREKNTHLVYCCNALWYRDTPQYYNHVLSKPKPQHYRTFKAAQVVRCCGSSFRNLDNYRRHMRTVHRQEMLRWIQEVRMYMVLKLKLYGNQTTPEMLEQLATPVTCCNYTFDNVVSLETHLDNVHSMPDWYMRSAKVTAMTQCRESYELYLAQVRRSLHPCEHGLPKVYKMAAEAFLRATNGMIMSWNENVDLEHREAFVRDLDRWRAAETATWGPGWDVRSRHRDDNPGSEVAASDYDDSDHEIGKVVFENSKKAHVVGRRSESPVRIASARDRQKFNANSSDPTQNPPSRELRSLRGSESLSGLRGAFVNQLPDAMMHQISSPGSLSDCTFYTAHEDQSQLQVPLPQTKASRAKQPRGKVHKHRNGLSAQAKEFVPSRASGPPTPVKL